MYILLPALGMPRLDFVAVAGGWVGATGRYARLIGLLLFLLGGIGWGFLYAALWPWKGMLGGMFFGLIPFACSHLLRGPVPGLLWLRVGGPGSVEANLLQHLIFGLVLGRFYQ